MENLEQTALFINATNEAFTGYWNSQPYKFGPAGSQNPPDRMYMELWKARHFAKHLTNRELLKIDGGEGHTSPKNPEQDPLFMDLFNKFVIVNSEEIPESMVQSEVMNLNAELYSNLPSTKIAKAAKAQEEEFADLSETKEPKKMGRPKKVLTDGKE